MACLTIGVHLRGVHAFLETGMAIMTLSDRQSGRAPHAAKGAAALQCRCSQVMLTRGSCARCCAYTGTLMILGICNSVLSDDGVHGVSGLPSNAWCRLYVLRRAGVFLEQWVLLSAFGRGLKFCMMLPRACLECVCSAVPFVARMRCSPSGMGSLAGPGLWTAGEYEAAVASAG